MKKHEPIKKRKSLLTIGKGSEFLLRMLAHALLIY